MLILPIKRKWFDMILEDDPRERKREEYREIKPYYTRRFQTAGLLDGNGRPTTHQADIGFRNGYSGDAPYFTARVSLDIKTGKPEWGAAPGIEYYALRVHEILAKANMG